MPLKPPLYSGFLYSILYIKKAAVEASTTSTPCPAACQSLYSLYSLYSYTSSTAIHPLQLYILYTTPLNWAHLNTTC